MEPVKTNVWKAGYWAGVLLAVFLLLLSITQVKSIFNIGDKSPATNMITVNGKGEKLIIPDIATFSFSVTETAKTVAEAQAQAATKSNAALDALKKQGIAEKDLKTTGYSINPHYEYTGGVCNQGGGICTPSKNTLTGYDVSQTVEVKIRDLKQAGAIFGSIGALEVQNVNGLSFTIDDIDSVKTDARSLAIDNAKMKAEKLAKELGVSLVRIVNFNDSSDSYYPYYGMGGDAMSAKVSAVEAPVANIPTGEQKITSNVSISYEIR